MRHDLTVLGRMVVAVAGAAAFVVASITIIEYAVNPDVITHWAGDTPMALNTAIALLLVGAALMIVGSHNRIWKNGRK